MMKAAASATILLLLSMVFVLSSEGAWRDVHVLLPALCRGSRRTAFLEVAALRDLALLAARGLIADPAQPEMIRVVLDGSGEPCLEEDWPFAVATVRVGHIEGPDGPSTECVEITIEHPQHEVETWLVPVESCEGEPRLGEPASPVDVCQVEDRRELVESLAGPIEPRAPEICPICSERVEKQNLTCRACGQAHHVKCGQIALDCVVCLEPLDTRGGSPVRAVVMLALFIFAVSGAAVLAAAGFSWLLVSVWKLGATTLTYRIVTPDAAGGQVNLAWLGSAARRAVTDRLDWYGVSRFLVEPVPGSPDRIAVILAADEPELESIAEMIEVRDVARFHEVLEVGSGVAGVRSPGPGETVARLACLTGADGKPWPERAYILRSAPEITGERLFSADLVSGRQGEPEILIEFNSNATEQWNEMCRRLKHRQVALVFGQWVYLVLPVNGLLESTAYRPFRLGGHLPFQAARAVVRALRSRALPAGLELLAGRRPAAQAHRPRPWFVMRSSTVIKTPGLPASYISVSG